MNTFPSAKLISEKNLVTTLVWCWKQIESRHFNVVMETRCDCSRCTHIPHLAAAHPICWRSANCHFSQNWPACPNFLFHSVSNYIFSRPRLPPTFVPPPLAPLNGDVTLPGELKSLRRKTLIFLFFGGFFCSHGLGQEPTHWDNRALFSQPGLGETPTQRAHFGVPVTLYPGKKSAFRIFSDCASASSWTSCQINLQNSQRIDDSSYSWSISHKNVDRLFMAQPAFPRG